MVETIDRCPLCREEISLDFPDRRVPARWREVVGYRPVWAEASSAFLACNSIEETARRVSLEAQQARLILQFLSAQVCGCRASTCVSCFDDDRSEL
jgi:hypothetical protein